MHIDNYLGGNMRFCLKTQTNWTGHIVQWLRALAVLAEDTGLSLSTQIVAHNHL